MNEFIFRPCNLIKRTFSSVFFFNILLKSFRWLFKRTPLFIFVVIANRLCTVFLRWPRIMLAIRGCLHETRNEISIHHKRNSIYITFHCGWNEMNVVSGVPEINGSLSKSQSFLFKHVQMFRFILFHLE